jgi:hypothetical protein
MAHVPVKNNSGVSLVVDQQPVGALGADAAHEPFRIAVRLRNTGRDLHNVDAFGGEDGVESGGELAVPVADQEVEGAGLITEVHQQVAGGLSCPGVCGVSGHAEEMDPAGADLHDEQDLQAAQGDGVEGEKVSSQQPDGLCAQETAPPGIATPWCRAKPSGSQDPPDSAGTDAVAESNEFSLDPAVAPGGVILRQTQHQGPDFIGDRRAGQTGGGRSSAWRSAGGARPAAWPA